MHQQHNFAIFLEEMEILYFIWNFETSTLHSFNVI